MGARDRLRDFFLDHVGEVVDQYTLSDVAGISEWARRVRELREDEGYQIHSHNDDPTLKQGQYRLVSEERLPPRDKHAVDQTTRARILLRNGYTCQLCGAAAGDPDEVHPGRKVRLHVHHVDPDGETIDSNLQTLCNCCNDGLSNVSRPPGTIDLLRTVRRASRKEQLEVYEWLQGKFEKSPE